MAGLMSSWMLCAVLECSMSKLAARQCACIHFIYFVREKELGKRDRERGGGGEREGEGGGCLFYVGFFFFCRRGNSAVEYLNSSLGFK